MAARDESRGACWRCVWFEPDRERSDDCGDCHRYPRVAYIGDDNTGFVWPSVEFIDWCGEFKEAE